MNNLCKAWVCPESRSKGKSQLGASDARGEAGWGRLGPTGADDEGAAAPGPPVRGSGAGVSAPVRPVLHTLWILSPPLWITLGTDGGQVGSGVWITRAPLGILEGAS